MRSKMSPRRALATASILAVMPACIFLFTVNRHSSEICNILSESPELNIERQKQIKGRCNQIVENYSWNSIYWVLLASTFINWPIIRWLDDRQWYREWIRKESED